MRLTELDPRWLVRGGLRVGILFRAPRADRPQSAGWYQVCTFKPMSFREQAQVVWAATDADLGPIGAAAENRHFSNWQPASPDFAWTADGDAFDTLTISPSIDGSKGGLWHGHITNGEIVGGLA